jgi:hypothetical protein
LCLCVTLFHGLAGKSEINRGERSEEDEGIGGGGHRVGDREREENERNKECTKKKRRK